MNRSFTRGAVAGALLLLVAASALAESASEAPARRRPLRERGRAEGVYGLTMLRVNAGLSSPTGDFGDVYNAGWGAGLSLAHGVSRTVLLSTGLAAHQFDGDFFDGDATIIPWTFNVDAVIPTEGRVRPWVGGGVGAYNIDAEVTAFVPGFGLVTLSDSETNIGINFGMGVGGPMGPRTLWGVGVRFHHVFEGDLFDNTDFATFQFGVGFPL